VKTLNNPILYKGIFTELKAGKCFPNVRIEYSTITWQNEQDFRADSIEKFAGNGLKRGSEGFARKLFTL
jgi:hypothetical protein